MNVWTFAWPSNETLGDKLADGLVNIFFLAKSYTLFSLMFGASFAYQIAAAERAQQSAAQRHYRRMSGLFVFGIIHATFFYEGDILIMYALIGAVLFGFRQSRSSFLLSLGIVFIAAQVLSLIHI